MSLVVREEEPADASGVRALHEAAFGRAAEAALVEALHRDGVVRYAAVAVDDDRVVAHALLSRIQVGGEGALALAPVAAAPDRQREGLGSAVVRAVLSAATADGERLVTVLGDPAYYSRFAFVPAVDHDVEPPEGWPREAYQVLLIGGAPPQGRAEYPAAFQNLG